MFDSSSVQPPSCCELFRQNIVMLRTLEKKTMFPVDFQKQGYAYNSFERKDLTSPMSLPPNRHSENFSAIVTSRPSGAAGYSGWWSSCS